VTIQLSTGPVGKYDWTNGTFANPPPNNTTATISYLGGPFVVDGSDFAAADGEMRTNLATTFSGSTSTSPTSPSRPTWRR